MKIAKDTSSSSSWKHVITAWPEYISVVQSPGNSITQWIAIVRIVYTIHTGILNIHIQPPRYTEPNRLVYYVDVFQTSFLSKNQMSYPLLTMRSQFFSAFQKPGWKGVGFQIEIEFGISSVWNLSKVTLVTLWWPILFEVQFVFKWCVWCQLHH